MVLGGVGGGGGTLGSEPAYGQQAETHCANELANEDRRT